MAIQHRTPDGRAGSLIGDDRGLFDVLRDATRPPSLVGVILADSLGLGLHPVQAHAQTVMEDKAKDLGMAHLQFAWRLVAKELARSFGKEEFGLTREALLHRERLRLGEAGALADVLPTTFQVQAHADGVRRRRPRMASARPGRVPGTHRHALRRCVGEIAGSPPGLEPYGAPVGAHGLLLAGA